MADSDFVLFKNSPIVDAATSNSTSQVGEPSLANNGEVVLLTGNWYGSVSQDGGGTWRYIDPYSNFPAANGGFCCDQVAIYDPSRDLMFWLLQYVNDGATNTLRLAIAQGTGAASNDWYYYDFTPVSVGGWTQEWFDYPDLALSDNFLYFSTNVFQINGGWTRAAVVRLSLDELAAGSGLSYNYYELDSHGSPRCTQGAGDTMYFGSHNSTSSFRMFSWPESETTVSHEDIEVSPWSAATRVAPGPDGRDWMGRADHRMTGAWVANGVAGFMWSAAQNGSTRPFPYVKVARVDTSSLTLIDQPDIWNPDLAFAYPAAGVNARGDIGLSMFYGGGAYYPSHCVAIDDDFTTSYPWSMVVTVNGTDGPDQNKWGDYLGCRAHAPAANTWIASGFSQQGGSLGADIEPRYIHFGRRRDTP